VPPIKVAVKVVVPLVPWVTEPLEGLTERAKLKAPSPNQ